MTTWQKALKIIAVLALATPVRAQHLDLAVFGVIPNADSASAPHYGFGATFEITDIRFVKLIGNADYMHNDAGPRAIAARVGVRVEAGGAFADWAAGRFIVHQPDADAYSVGDGWSASLSAGWVFGNIGLFGRWYYDIPDRSSTPDLYALGAFLRL